MSACDEARVVRLSECIAPAFVAVWHAIKESAATHFWLKGGRGSTKSSFAAIVIVLLIKMRPNLNAVVLRKVAGTMRDSVFAQVWWAVDKLGLTREFRKSVSPMEIVYKPTGQRILFRGADDPDKLKSIKCAVGYVGIVWFEELDQFAGMAEVRSILQTLLRGGDSATVLYSYNPPRSRDSWANMAAKQHAGQPGYFVHTSDYRDVPREWLGEQFYEIAEELLRKEGKTEKQAEADEKAYRHEYLGEEVGTGGSVFENVELRRLTDEEVGQFDRTFSGVDFGWFPDPWCYVRCHYDHARRTLYLFDEDNAVRLKNADAAERIKAKLTVVPKRPDGSDAEPVTLRELVTCDSAEPKSIGDYRDAGLDARPVVKGAGSVEYGMKWLQSLALIVIDPERCPLAAVEFPLYEYERNRDGSYSSTYPDANNHSIDAVRYAMSTTANRRFSS